jgi:hypothetical protein
LADQPDADAARKMGGGNRRIARVSTWALVPVPPAVLNGQRQAGERLIEVGRSRLFSTASCEIRGASGWSVMRSMNAFCHRLQRSLTRCSPMVETVSVLIALPHSEPAP